MGCAEPSPPNEDGLGGEAAINTCVGGAFQQEHLTITDVGAGVGTDTWIDIEGHADSIIDLYGVRICQPPTCATFNPKVRLQPNVTLRAHFGISDPGDVTDPCEPQVYFESATLQVGEQVLLIAPGTTNIEDPTRILFEYD